MRENLKRSIPPLLIFFGQRPIVDNTLLNATYLLQNVFHFIFLGGLLQVIKYHAIVNTLHKHYCLLIVPIVPLSKVFQE